jgi:hypothetical protein
METDNETHLLIANRLTHSVSLLAGTCPFKQTNNTNITTSSILEDTESHRNTLIKNTLQVAQEIFNSSLKAEEEHLPLLEALITTSPHRTALSHSNKPSHHQPAHLLPRTPLEELYLPPQPDHLAVWHQLSLRQNCINNWVRETLDLDVQADHPQDNDTTTLTLPDGDSTDQINLDSSQHFTDSDELSSLEDQSDESSYATEQLFSSSDEDSNDNSELNQSYTTTLNDADDDSSQTSAENGEDDDEDDCQRKKKKEDRSPATMLSLDDLESRSSSKNVPKRARSAVDSDFFSLAEFEQEAEDGEAEMRRKLRRLAGQSGQPEDEEDSDDDQEIDLFSRFDTGLIEDEDKLEDDDDDDDKGDQVDLDSVAGTCNFVYSPYLSSS